MGTHTRRVVLCYFLCIASDQAASAVGQTLVEKR